MNINDIYPIATNYKLSQPFSFKNDKRFIDFLYNNYRDVLTFINCCKSKDVRAEGFLAGITVDPKEGSAILYVNEGAFYYILKELPNIIGEEDAYRIATFILIHEMLHVQLRHFRVSTAITDIKKHNTATDMIIDNFIYSYEDDGKRLWRNWREVIKTYSVPLSTNVGDKNYILHYTDLQIYRMIEDLPIEITKHRFDEHGWDEEGKIGETELSEESQEAGDKYDRIEYQRRRKNEIFERLAEKIEDEIEAIGSNWLGSGAMRLKLIKTLRERRFYKWMKKLEKYLKVISRQLRTATWKKVHKKLSSIYPGYKSTLKPGEILIAVDTSGSMEHFLYSESYKDVMRGIYTLLREISRIYKPPTKILRVDVDTDIQKVEEIKSLDELLEHQPVGLGGTEFKSFFDWVVKDWKKHSPLHKKIPDLTIFITDLETKFDFLGDYKYKIFKNKLVWLVPILEGVVGKLLNPPTIPPLGEIIPVPYTQ